MIWRIIATGFLFGFLIVAAQADVREAEPDSFALHAGWIYTCSDSAQDGATLLKDATIWVEGGRIKAVGCNLDLPQGLPVLDFRREIVVPGLVAAGIGSVPAMGRKETVSARYRALDGFDPYGDYRMLLAGGITTIYLHPGSQRLVSGVGAVVKVPGFSEIGADLEEDCVLEDCVLEDGGDLCVNLGAQAFNPPPLQEYPLPASSATQIPPAVPQRPTSRLGQYIEIREAFERAGAYAKKRDKDIAGAEQEFDYNLAVLAEVLSEKPRLRIDAQHIEEIEGALRLLASLGMEGYLTGAAEAHQAVPSLKKSGLALVLELPTSLGRPGRDIGFDRDHLEARLETAALLEEAGIPFALATPRVERTEDLMLAAALAVRGGLSRDTALKALTRIPAEILGVADRVGSIAVGKDADFLVLSGQPFKVQTHVLKVYSSGREVFDHPAAQACTVLRAAKVYPVSGPPLVNAAVLIEGGKIAAVGTHVPHPPGAKVIDAGPNSVITPGFIDGHGHLGLEGDATSPGTEISLARAVVRPGHRFARVARAGITTTILAPRAVKTRGAQMAAIKTAGSAKDDLVVQEYVGLKFSFVGKDPFMAGDALQQALKAGKAYTDKWNKYYDDLKKWEEEQTSKKSSPEEADKVKKEAIQKTTSPAEEDKEKSQDSEIDPITGTWTYTIAGPPLPEPREGTLRLKLEDGVISGSVKTVMRGEELESTVTGTLKGDEVVLEYEVESRGGKPRVEARLDEEDHMVGEMLMGSYFRLSFEASRTEKSAPVFKVISRKKKRADGRPEPPKIDNKLEPYRPLFAGKAVALVEVDTAAEIEKVIQDFADEYQVALGLLGAREADKVAERIRAAGAGVVLPARVLAKKKGADYLQADALARAGIPIVFQSNAEDGAATLPMQAAYAVHKGLDPSEALKALTLHAARLYRIDHRVGSLEKGKDADLIVFCGEPLELESAVINVFINGKEVLP